MNNIELVQLPIIKHQIRESGKLITEQIENLDIENLIPSIESLQSLKTLRADLNSDFKKYEEQRKFVKKAINEPYAEMETVYKDEIATKITEAIEKLKDKITIVENQVKDAKKAELKGYFEELVKSENIDFLKFEDAKLKIDLSTTEKKLKEQADEFVSKVSTDLKLIETQEHKVEIEVEYKKTLNISKAITDVVERKEAERKAVLIREQKIWDRKVELLRDLAMVLHTTTKTFEFNEEIHISEEEVKKATPDQFVLLLSEQKTKIDAYLESKKPKAVEPEKEAIKEPVKRAEPIAKPIAQKEPEKLIKTGFRVEATYKKLKELIKYMDQNEISYTDI